MSSRKDAIHSYVELIAMEVLEHIKEKEGFFQDRWVPSVEIKSDLELNFVAVPKSNEQYGPKGWLMAIAARMLEDKELVEFKKIGSRSFYRSK